MAGRLFQNWWSLVSPYYTNANKEVWPGVIIMAYAYYKLSYGGKKAVEEKPKH